MWLRFWRVCGGKRGEGEGEGFGWIDILRPFQQLFTGIGSPDRRAALDFPKEKYG